MPPPPPPPPPGPGPPPPPLSGGSKGGGAPNRSALLDQIHHGARLKKTVTNDRSAPQLAEGKSTGGSSGGRGRGGDTPMGGLFAGGVPKLRPPGQSKVPGGSGSLALKPPTSMSNGPATAHAHDYHSNGGPPPLPPSTSKPQANKQGPPAPPPSFSRPNNTGPPPIPDNSKSSNVGPPGRLNLNAFKQLNDPSVHENKIKLDSPRSNVPFVSGGLASNNTPNRPAIPKLPGSSGGSPAASGIPPPPPSRPSPSDATRPNNIMNRPLPPPPGDNGTATVSPSRVPPPPPSRVPAPPPSISKTAAAPPPPPQRIAPNIPAGGTIGRSPPPSIRPPVPSSSLPSPPKTRPPSGSRTPGNEDDFETRFMFHQTNEFSLPEPVTIMTKTYPSRKNSDRQRPPPPQPPR